MIDDQQREALLAAIKGGSAYKLAQEDVELLAEHDLRPLRLQLELLKPERALRVQDINSTVVVFGSARIISLAEAQTRMDALNKQGSDGSNAASLQARANARRGLAQAR